MPVAAVSWLRRGQVSKQGWALPRPAKGPLFQASGLWTSIYLDKCLPKACLWRSLRQSLNLASFLLVAAGPAWAQPAGCAAVFAGGRPPVLLNQRLAARTHALCFGAYAVLASGVSRGPLWFAEHLSPASVEAARGMTRVDAFHAEEALPEADRADPEDYVRSGFDRGHMSPSGDMPDEESQHASFSMANIVPQAPDLNRGLWSRIEGAVRNLADGQGGAGGDIYVVTGPVFRGSNLRSLPAGELVPSAVFKAVLEPGLGAAAYVCANRDPSRCRVVSIAQLSARIGLDPFPSLAADARMTAIALPAPGRNRSRRHRSPRSVP
jgi:endonuclease G